MADIMDEPLPDLGGISARQLLDAWSVLAPLGHLVAERLPQTREPTRGTINSAASSFDIHSLAQAVSRCTDMSIGTAQKVLAALTLSGSPREDIWHRPFVPLDSKLAPLVVALTAPNLMRSIEEWLRAGGLDLGKRGPLFESYVRDSLARDTRLTNAYIHAKPISTTAAIGDIDLWIQLGTTIVLGEMKCSLFPASPLEQYKYEQTLAGASQQALAKAAWARKNLAALFQQVGQVLPQNPVSVLPLVVSNLPLASGITMNDVPVVDSIILMKFFSEGCLEQRVMLGIDGRPRAGTTLAFYSTPREAEAAVGPYLRNPPQVSTILPMVHVADRPLVAIGGTTVSMTVSEVAITPGDLQLTQ